MAFCPNCGWQHDGTAHFCQQCGKPLGATVATPPTASMPAPPTAAYGAGYPPPSPPMGNTPDWISEEHDLWLGKTIDMATQGAVSPNHYRLTTRSLFYAHGRIGSVENSVPLWAVKGVTIDQSIVDKARHVGSLIVTEVRLDDIENPQEIRDLILRQAREENYNYERRNQTMFYQGRPPYPPR